MVNLSTTERHMINTYLSIHHVTKIDAYTDNSFDHPLTLTIDGAHGRMRVALFFDVNYGGDYLERLADAINAVPMQLQQEIK
jgi:hypothetical protein